MTILQQFPLVHVFSLISMNSSRPKGDQMYFDTNSDEFLVHEDVCEIYTGFPSASDIEEYFVKKKQVVDFSEDGKDMAVSLMLKMVGDRKYITDLNKVFTDTYKKIKKSDKLGAVVDSVELEKFSLPKTPLHVLEVVEKKREENKVYNLINEFTAVSASIYNRAEKLDMAKVLYSGWSDKNKKGIETVLTRAEEEKKAINIVNGNFVASKSTTYFINTYSGVQLAIPKTKIESDYLADKVFEGFKLLLAKKGGAVNKRVSTKVSETKTKDVEKARTIRQRGTSSSEIDDRLRRNAGRPTKTAVPDRSKVVRVAPTISELDDNDFEDESDGYDSVVKDTNMREEEYDSDEY